MLQKIWILNKNRYLIRWYNTQIINLGFILEH